MRVHFTPVRMGAMKSGKCAVCGKNTTRRTVIEHTINPFNRNKFGQMKTEEEVLEDVKKVRVLWLQKPVMHKKCEKKGVSYVK